MSRKQLIYCDICGIEKEQLGTSWTVGIHKLLLEFKKFPNIQNNILKEDCCTNCAVKIYDKITRTIESIKEQNEKKKN